MVLLAVSYKSCFYQRNLNLFYTDIIKIKKLFSDVLGGKIDIILLLYIIIRMFLCHVNLTDATLVYLFISCLCYKS